MNTFSWTKGIIYGIIIWVAMFIVASILIAFGATIGIGWSITLAAFMGLMSYFLATSTHAESGSYALSYGLLWAAIGIALDLLISRQFQSNIFGMWTYWMGYALVLVAPWLHYEIRATAAHPTVV